MKPTKRKVLLIFVLLFASMIAVFAGNEKTAIYNAYLTNDMKTWRKIIDQMNAEKGKSNERSLELLNYEYGYIGWCIGMKNKTEAREIIARGQLNIETLEKNNFSQSMIYAYKSAFYGFEIALNKTKAPFLGGKSMNQAEKSVKFDANNPYGYLQLGNIEFYMPKVFGGSKKKAIAYYQKAEKLMMKSDYKNNWNYLSLITQIAQTYQELNDDKNAEIYYKRVLSTAPNFTWVKNELYPKFLKNKK